MRVWFITKLQKNRKENIFLQFRKFRIDLIVSIKIKYNICDVSLTSFPQEWVTQISHELKLCVFYYEANTNSDCVIFSSCRDPCRLTTGCTPSTLATTTSGYHRCWRVRVETRPGEAEGSFDSCWPAFASLSTTVRNRREHDGPLYGLWMLSRFE